MSHPHLPPPVVHAADMGAIFAIIGAWSGALPAIAALLAVIWYLIQIYDRVTRKKD